MDLVRAVQADLPEARGDLEVPVEKAVLVLAAAEVVEALVQAASAVDVVVKAVVLAAL